MDRGADLVPRTAARGSASLTEKLLEVTRLGHPLTFGEFLHGLETPSRISDPPRESGVN